MTEPNPAPQPDPSPAPPAWFAGFDDETKGYVVNRGWDKLTPDKAFFEAAKAHRSAEKLIGAPANELVRLPKDANAPEWAGVWQRLGAPTDGKDYDFSGLKFADGEEVDQGFTDYMRARATELHLPKETATRMAAAFVKFLDDADKAELAEKTAAIANEKVALKKNWGANEPANMLVAQNTLRTLLGSTGMTAEQIAQATSALEGAVGYSNTMEIFRQIGTRIGEDRFVRSAAPGGTGAMTVEQAKATLAERKADSDWSKRYTAGGSAEKREMDALLRIIHGVAA